MKKLGLFVMALATLCFMGCEDKTKITKINVPATMEVAAGETKRITPLSTTPAGLTAQIAWASSDTTIATVKAGKVTGVTIGKTTITATAGDIQEEIEVTVKDASYDLNIVEYGLFGTFSDPIPGYNDTIEVVGGKKIPCSLRRISRIYAWDENIIFKDGEGFIGNGFICAFEDVPVYVEDDTIGGYKYIGYGGFVAKSIGKSEAPRAFTADAGTFDPESYGEYLAYIYGDASADTTLAIDTVLTRMQAKNHGAFITQAYVTESGQRVDAYNYLYSGHINRFFFIQATDTTDARFAADITFGNLDGTKYLFGYEIDESVWETYGMISMLRPFADHYKTVNMVYDETGLFSAKIAPKYQRGDMSKYHKELPTINGKPADKYKFSIR